MGRDAYNALVRKPVARQKALADAIPKGWIVSPDHRSYTMEHEHHTVVCRLANGLSGFVVEWRAKVDTAIFSQVGMHPDAETAVAHAIQVHRELLVHRCGCNRGERV